MKVRGCFLVVMGLSFSVAAMGQTGLQLRCPLNEAIDPPPEKKSYSIGADNLKASFTSKTDTTVTACTDGIITTILHDEDGKWEILFRQDDYSFWYSGLGRLTVAKGQKIKEGDIVGYIKKGDRFVLQLFDNESPLDPRDFLQCK